MFIKMSEFDATKAGGQKTRLCGFFIYPKPEPRRFLVLLKRDPSWFFYFLLLQICSWTLCLKDGGHDRGKLNNERRGCRWNRPYASGSYAYHHLNEMVEHWTFIKGRTPQSDEISDLEKRIILQEGHLWIKNTSRIMMCWWKRDGQKQNRSRRLNLDHSDKGGLGREGEIHAEHN